MSQEGDDSVVLANHDTCTVTSESDELLVPVRHAKPRHRSRDGIEDSGGIRSLDVDISCKVDCNGPTIGGGKPSQPPVLLSR